MRLSGNYFDRLLINILPWTIFTSLIIYYTSKDIQGGLVTFVILSAALWLLDTLIIYFKYKNPKPLKTNPSLKWGNRTISSTEIVRITPITDKRYRWKFDLIEFYLDDGTTFLIIDKPRNFMAAIIDTPSTTIKRLIKKYPELELKIKGRRDI